MQPLHDLKDWVIDKISQPKPKDATEDTERKSDRENADKDAENLSDASYFKVVLSFPKSSAQFTLCDNKTQFFRKYVSQKSCKQDQ